MDLSNVWIKNYLTIQFPDKKKPWPNYKSAGHGLTFLYNVNCTL
jgi:hypothetical protein